MHMQEWMRRDLLLLGLQESRRRLKKKANQLHINDMDKAQQKYGSKMMDQILEEYLQQHNPKIAIVVDQL